MIIIEEVATRLVWVFVVEGNFQTTSYMFART